MERQTELENENNELKAAFEKCKNESSMAQSQQDSW